MPKIKLIPSEWGSLEMNIPLNHAEIEAKAHQLLKQMTLEEKIDQMSGDFPSFPTLLEMYTIYTKTPYPAGENFRLQIPGIRFCDGPRGIVLNHSTCFPVSMARGATWDLNLEERIGEAMGIEARTLGANLVASVCINILRHPAWGRAQETYGEDPYHLGEMGAASVRGLQRHVMACIKHYACNNIENSRLKVDVQISERTLREIYLPQFKRCVDEGAACVMGAYNKVNGAYCCQNIHLLRDILKDEWGFQGFVISDFTLALHDSQASLQAGLDLEMPIKRYYGKNLVKLIQQDQARVELIDEAVIRLLRQKIRFAQVGEKRLYRSNMVACKTHLSLAREAAIKSIVLLKNEPPANQRWLADHIPSFFNIFKVQPTETSSSSHRGRSVHREDIDGQPALDEPILPLNLNKINRLAVIGKLAHMPNLGDHGSSWVRPPHAISPLEGITRLAQDRCEVIFDDAKNPTSATAKARKADIAIILAGYTYKDEGEKLPGRGGDRKSLELSQLDMTLILSTLAANPRTVVILMGGGPIVMDKWIDFAPAVLMAWYPGMEGGHALADILFGLANPSGKLPCVFPRSADQLPPFDNRAKTVEYGYYHGYRLIDKINNAPLFHFGHGLSYTTYTYHDLVISNKSLSIEDSLSAQISVTNTGKRIGEEVAQLYIGYPGSIYRPVKELKGFQRVRLEPGETAIIQFSLPVSNLAYYDESSSAWVVEPGEYTVWIGGSSKDESLIRSSFHIE